jgi:hypothetical protein
VSRGPGRAQRLVLDELAKVGVKAGPDGWLWAANLTWEYAGLDYDAAARDEGPEPTRAQEESIRRACRQLAKAGQVEIGYGHLYAGGTSIGRDMRVRLPLPPELAAEEGRYNRERVAEALGPLARR